MFLGMFCSYRGAILHERLAARRGRRCRVTVRVCVFRVFVLALGATGGLPPVPIRSSKETLVDEPPVAPHLPVAHDRRCMSHKLRPRPLSRRSSIDC